ncbi:uncharacterized protein PODANS_6_10107 [Podospora anserina S mat+]|uniref:Podospora anserina S mat+ genomic DNA chromosome 6, supercontig 4 n=1 Tax=Podospora anserina (strain S / ATCC MYA-4624 / DSM 980 / FGSC 10383) TaxID=515849 RepID=B2ANB8_PODAN|nr:uncharacterized protein PODANS_6_10107 [Podospora anserina S mat+]CAP65516.1 unnamed protein product [Podospora anserina S mat+]CDP31511.1 Putative protein of unknown function [Podospora anserina S mat+]
MHSSLNDHGDLMYSSKHRKEWDHVLHSDTYYGVDDVEPLWERDEDEFCVGVLDFHRDEISKRIKRSGLWDTLILGILQQREFRIMGYLRRRLWGNAVADLQQQVPCHARSHETCGPIEDFQKLKRKLLEDVEYRKTLLFTDEMREDAKRQRVIWFGVENPR